MTGDRSATTADVEKSIQIALDAADAAMDVTSEYAKVAQQIKKSTLKLSGIEKLGRTSMIVGFYCKFRCCCAFNNCISTSIITVKALISYKHRAFKTQSF